MNFQDISFGDFTEEEFKVYFLTDHENISSLSQFALNGVELPWKFPDKNNNSSIRIDCKKKSSELLVVKPQQATTSNSSKCYLNSKNNKKSRKTSGININLQKEPLVLKQNLSSTSTTTTTSSVLSSKSSSMDNLTDQQKLQHQLEHQQQKQEQEQQQNANAAALNDSQRRNKKRKPPDYYKNNYPVDILKRENEKKEEQERQQQLQNALNNKQQSQTTTTITTVKQSNEDFEDDDDGTGSFESGVVSSNSITNSNPEENEIETSSNVTSTTNNSVDIKESIAALKITQEAPAQPTSAPPANPWASGPKVWSSLFKGTKPPTEQATPSTTSNPVATTTSSSASRKPSDDNKSKTNTTNTTAAAAAIPSSSTTTTTTTTTTLPSSDLLKQLGEMFEQCELKHSAPALQPRGIKNKSNWCYVNATLQALLACPPFYNFMKQSYGKIKQLNIDHQHVPCIYALGKFVNEFKTMVRSSQSDSSKPKAKDLVIGDPFEIDYFYDAIANLRTDFQFRGRQEDAQEFLSFLLNRLHDEMIKCLESQDSKNATANTNGESEHDNSHNSKATTTVNGAAAAANGNNDEEEEDEWKEVGKKNRAFVTRRTEFKQSPLSDIFCGQFRSALSQAGSREKETVSLEPFFTLPLDIQNDNIRSVTEALDHLVKKEEILDYTNQDTKQNVQAFKRISFEDLPPVLIIYLKCFIYDKSGGILKLCKRLDYAIDLEISKELISQNQRSKLRGKKQNYKLFAVEYHYGEKATGGHYITDVYHPGIVGWVRYDDANVKVVTNQNVLKSDDRKLSPYLLYYRRTDLI